MFAAAGTIPLIFWAGLTVNNTPLQEVVDIGVIAGTGLTVTFTTNVAPVQTPATGTT